MIRNTLISLLMCWGLCSFASESVDKVLIQTNENSEIVKTLAKFVDFEKPSVKVAVGAALGIEIHLPPAADMNMEKMPAEVTKYFPGLSRIYVINNARAFVQEGANCIRIYYSEKYIRNFMKENTAKLDQAVVPFYLGGLPGSSRLIAALAKSIDFENLSDNDWKAITKEITIVEQHGERKISFEKACEKYTRAGVDVAIKKALRLGFKSVGMEE